MNISELAKMKEDRLANSAVTAFLGSLLMGQSWQMWEGSQATTKLLMFTVPDYSALVILTIMSGLFVLSLFLATASIVTPLQRLGLSVTRWASPIMLPVVAASFILSWVSSSLKLPQDQWWSPVLFIGGFVMFIFVAFRPMVAPLIRFLGRRIGRAAMPKLLDDTEPGGRNDGEPNGPPGRIALFEQMRNLRSRYRMPESRGFWVILSIVVVVIEVILVVVLWDWLADNESGSATIRNIGLVIAGSVAIPLAIWRAVVADKQASSAQHQTTIAQQGLLNERYQKGAEMLGSNVLSVRLGGIYALKRLAEERPEHYHIQVMQLFCAFVQHPTKDQRLEPGRAVIEPGTLLGISQDVKAVVDAICSRGHSRIALERKEDFKLDLQGADLPGVQFLDADLSHAMFHHAKLPGVNIANTDLTDAFFNYSDLSDAKFRNVNFNRTRFFAANLSGAKLQDAELTDTDFHNADLSGANLWRANLHGAIFQDAKLCRAWLESANLSNSGFLGADLSGARLVKADLSGAHFLSASLDNVNLTDANLSGTEFSIDGPQTAKGLTQAQLDQARADPSDPPNLAGVLDAETGLPLVWRGNDK